jgi:hypothetical protein
MRRRRWPQEHQRRRCEGGGGRRNTSGEEAAGVVEGEDRQAAAAALSRSIARSRAERDEGRGGAAGLRGLRSIWWKMVSVEMYDLRLTDLFPVPTPQKVASLFYPYISIHILALLMLLFLYACQRNLSAYVVVLIIVFAVGDH